LGGSVAIATASFFLYEVPLMKLGAKFHPTHVIGAGLLSTIGVAAFVLMATSGYLSLGIFVGSVATAAASFALHNLQLMKCSATVHQKCGVATGLLSAAGVAVILMLAATAISTELSRVGNQPRVASSHVGSQAHEQNVVVFFGDSQAVRIASLMQENRKRSLTSKCNNFTVDQWDPVALSAAHGGGGFVQYMGVLNLITENSVKMLKRQKLTDPPQWDAISLDYAVDGIEIIQGLKTTKKTRKLARPAYAFVMDSHVMSPWYGRNEHGLYGNRPHYIDAVRLLVQTLAKNEFRHLFLSSGTPYMWHELTKGADGTTVDFITRSTEKKGPARHTYLRAADEQLAVYRDALKHGKGHGAKCDPNAPGKDDKVIHVTVVQYHKLVCPDADTRRRHAVTTATGLLWNAKDGYVKPFELPNRMVREAVQCSKSAHGFRDLLPDNWHAESGDAGYFLAAQLQKIMGIAIAATEGIANASRILESAACAGKLYGDRDVDHSQLFQTHKVCVPVETLERNVESVERVKQLLKSSRGAYLGKSGFTLDATGQPHRKNKPKLNQKNQ
jgi:hypothetical protein